MQNGWTILLPTRPQPDTVVAIFLLKTFGDNKFPGIKNLSIRVQPMLPSEESFTSLFEKNTIALDLGGGPLDHHGSTHCTSELVARYLDIANDPSIKQLLHYASRDDKHGKGTLSRDPLDRAFGLSGLIAALNKANPKDPQKIVESVLPLLEAHLQSAKEHHVELPLEVGQKRRAGAYEEFRVTQGNKEFLVACVISDKPTMPTYLRSQSGPRADVVVQKAEHTNHFCVLTNQRRGVNLATAAALIRLREGEYLGLDLGNDPVYLGQPGRIAEIEQWYYDQATNSLLNGGSHNTTTPESNIGWDELKQIVRTGLELG